VYSTAEGLLNSNTAGLPSVAEAGVIATVGASLLLIVPVAEAVPETIVSLDSAIVSAVVGTPQFP
jgi:hypothetical protein